MFHHLCVKVRPCVVQIIFKGNLAWHIFWHTHTLTVQLLSGLSCWCLNGKTSLTCARPPTGAARVCVGSSSVGECSALPVVPLATFHTYLFSGCMPWRLHLRAWKLNECLQANRKHFLVQNVSMSRMEGWKYVCFFSNGTVINLFPHFVRRSISFYMRFLGRKVFTIYSLCDGICLIPVVQPSAEESTC